MSTVTEAELRRMITSHALQSTRAGWRDWCQRLMWNVADLVGGVRETYPTATAAYHASRIESRDASLAPPGAAHYWHEPYPYGHVAFDLDGGGTRVLMATSFATDWWGNGAGTVSIRDYTNRTGSQYLGWSRANGRNQLPVLAATTAASTTPAPIPEEDDMQTIIKSPNRPHALLTGGMFRVLANSEELRVVQKVDTQILDNLNDREYDVLRAVYSRGRGVTAGEVEAIVKRLPVVVGDVDVDAIAAAVNDELAARLS